MALPSRSLAVVIVRRQELRERVGDECFVGALPVDQTSRKNAHSTGSMLRVATAGHLIHGVSELHATADERRDAVGQRHRERSTDAYASVAGHNRGPRAGAHAP